MCAANLQDWADSKYLGPMPSELVAIHQLACGLEFVHEKSYVHRDICPANILIHIGGDRLIISDFGLCKQVHASGAFTVTQHNGQKKWLAPERIQEMNDSTYRVTNDCDTWAMGCVFYFFITKGSHPFDDGEVSTKILNNITEGKYNVESKSFFFHILKFGCNS